MDLDLKIISATDLHKPNLLPSKLHPYVVVSISDATHKTPIDKSGNRNPTWNHPLTFSLPIDESNLTLTFRIRSRRSIASDKLIGEVFVPLRDLLESASDGKFKTPTSFVSYQVRKPSGKPKGVLTFSYRFNTMHYPTKPQPTSAVFQVSAPLDVYPPIPTSEAVTRYPKYKVYPPPESYGYPEQSGYGYGYPKQSGYGYGYPNPEGCGYPVQAGNGYGPYNRSGYGYEYGGETSRKKSGGLGLGAGLLGGAVAGMLIGDVALD